MGHERLRSGAGSHVPVKWLARRAARSKIALSMAPLAQVMFMRAAKALHVAWNTRLRRYLYLFDTCALLHMRSYVWHPDSLADAECSAQKFSEPTPYLIGRYYSRSGPPFQHYSS